MQFPMIVSADHLSVIQNTRGHVPDTNGVLHVKVIGCRYYYLWTKPPKTTTQPTTQPTTKPTTQPTTQPRIIVPISKIIGLSPMPLTPFTEEPIFDFFAKGEGIKEATKKLMKRPVSSTGSCFIVAKQYGYYYAITARHVILVPEAKVFVDGQQGEIVSITSMADVALLKFKSNKTYPIYKSTTNAKVLDNAWLVGYPGDVIGTVRKFTVKGSVCNVSKTEIWFAGGGARGMSGGPMLNDKDEVIGVISRFLLSLKPCDNFINSVPSRYFKYEVEKILLKEKIKDLTNKINTTKKKKS
jgi:hypothetical protein